MAMSAYIRRIRERIGDDLLLIPTVAGAVMRDGAVLLVRHADAGQWVLPGGMVEPDEVPREALVREMAEESGLAVELDGIVDTFGGPAFTWTYRNGHRIAFVMTLYRCSASGAPRPDGIETVEVAWVDSEQWRSLQRPAWMDVVMPVLFAGGG